MPPAADRLRTLLARPGLLLMPGCHDAISARLIGEAGFEVGTRTTVDVLDARRRLFESQRDYARSRYDYLINLVKLKSAAGVLVPADLNAINGYLTTPTTLPVVRPDPAAKPTG